MKDQRPLIDQKEFNLSDYIIHQKKDPFMVYLSLTHLANVRPHQKRLP